jgi:hypothetical protein
LSWPGAAILDAGFVQAGPDAGRLWVLSSDGALSEMDLDSGLNTRRCVLELPAFTVREGHWRRPLRHRLHLSASGEYAAVVVDYGLGGVVVRCATGEVTMRLDGGDYHEDTVPFSACFIRHHGRDVLIHRTAWNRLDASDVATGQLLTARHIAPYDKEQPAHYLDYFHGRLIPSPDGRRLFDDGWVWQPVAVPSAWSISDWLDLNPWESEDGASIVTITQRDDWDKPACWIDERHIALWDLADWDDDEFEETKQGPGVRISDVTETLAEGQFWLSARKLPMPDQGEARGLFSDGERLFVATDAGTSVWDIASGAQCGNIDGFVAHLLDRSNRRLVSLAPDGIHGLRAP